MFGQSRRYFPYTSSKLATTAYNIASPGVRRHKSYVSSLCIQCCWETTFRGSYTFAPVLRTLLFLCASLLLLLLLVFSLLLQTRCRTRGDFTFFFLSFRGILFFRVRVFHFHDERARVTRDVFAGRLEHVFDCKTEYNYFNYPLDGCGFIFFHDYRYLSERKLAVI